VDHDSNCTRTIKENLTYCKLEGEIVKQTAESFLETHECSTYDLILLDPPYVKEKIDLSNTHLTKLLQEKALPETIIIWEHAFLNTWSIPPFNILKQSKYGDTIVTTFLKD
jgi:16S rRNA G966 N2-methylase RsmD